MPELEHMTEVVFDVQRQIRDLQRQINDLTVAGALLADSTRERFNAVVQALQEADHE